MMSGASIAAMALEQAELAEIEGIEPVRFSWDDISTFPPFPFPFIGGYVPEGFEPLLDDDGEPIQLFCDSSGFGSSSELALTADQVVDELRRLVLEFGQTANRKPAHLYGAIVEAGQFQVYLGVFRKC